MKQLRGFKYRFYPTSAQRLELAQTFGCARFVYNWALALRTNSYYEDNVALSYTDTSKERAPRQASGLSSNGDKSLTDLVNLG